jgi:hypothetical protein
MVRLDSYPAEESPEFFCSEVAWKTGNEKCEQARTWF